MAKLYWTPTTKSPEGQLGFDVTESEALELSSTVTEHPVETGANVTDHVRKNLDKLTLVVFVSNTPITDENFVDPTQPRGTVNNVLLSGDNLYTGPVPPPQTRIDPHEYLSLNSPLSLGGLVGSAARAIAAIGPVFVQVGVQPTEHPDTFASVLTFPEAFSATIETYDALTQLQDDATLVSVILRDSVHDDMLIVGISKPRSVDTGDGAEFTVQLQQVRIVQTKTTTSPIPTEPRALSPVSRGSTGAATASPAMSSGATQILAKFGVVL